MALTEEDKNWFTGELSKNQESIRGEFAWVKDEFASITGEFASVRNEFVRINGEIARLDAKIEHVETALLTAFHQWASPQEMRQRTHTAAIRALDTEVEYIADRVTKFEGKEPAA